MVCIEYFKGYEGGGGILKNMWNHCYAFSTGSRLILQIMRSSNPVHIGYIILLPCNLRYIKSFVKNTL